MSLTLEELSARLKTLDAVGHAIASDAAPEVQAIARGTAAAGTDAYGTAWAPTKAGTPPLVNAAGSVSAVVGGLSQAAVVLVLKGVYIFHQYGVGKSTPARPILPTKALGAPPAMLAAVRRAAQRVTGRALA